MAADRVGVPAAIRVAGIYAGRVGIHRGVAAKIVERGFRMAEGEHRTDEKVMGKPVIGPGLGRAGRAIGMGDSVGGIGEVLREQDVARNEDVPRVGMLTGLDNVLAVVHVAAAQIVIVDIAEETRAGGGNCWQSTLTGNKEFFP